MASKFSMFTLSTEMSILWSAIFWYSIHISNVVINVTINPSFHNLATLHLMRSIEKELSCLELLVVPPWLQVNLYNICHGHGGVGEVKKQERQTHKIYIRMIWEAKELFLKQLQIIKS